MVVTRINGVAIHHFGSAPTKRRAAGKKAHDAGQALQIRIANYLDASLPPTHIYTASAMGVYLPMKTAQALKDMGGKRGWGDYQILFPSAVTRFIEAKAGTGRLTPEQEAFRDFCYATGRDIWALAHSVEDVHEALVRWKVPVRCGPEGGDRYAVGWRP